MASAVMPAYPAMSGESMPERGGDGLRESFEELYARTVGLLRFIAHVRYRIPLADAEGIVQDAFLKLVRDYAGVRDPLRWLTATVSNASKNYLRDHGREVPLPPDAEERWHDPISDREIEAIHTRLALGATFAKLTGRCRDVLLRFHVHHESTAVIAEALGTTAAYIQLLLHLCRKRARQIYLTLTKVVTHDA